MEISVPPWSRFPQVELSSPIDWKLNPFQNGLWAHHFLSLRWIFELKEVLDRPPQEAIVTTAAVLNEFLSYHDNANNAVSQYYMGRVSDHTCAERLDTFSRVLALAAAVQSSSMLDMRALRREINLLLRFLRTDLTYREQSNHGLMIDLSMIRFCLRHPEYDRNGEFMRLATARAVKQMNSIFAPDYVMREHSVVYQEYNLWNCAKAAADIAPYAGKGADEVRILAESIVRHGSDFLIWAVKPNGEYAALGDSFRHPNKDRIRDLLPFSGEKADYLTGAKAASSKFMEAGGIKAFWDGGFGFLAASEGTSVPDVHVGFTCCWHSYIHKQQDETALTLFANGHNVIDDPGFSDSLAHDASLRQQMLSAENHSVVFSRETPWSSNQNDRFASRIVGMVRHSRVRGFVGEHRRIPQTAVRRYVLLVDERTLIVADQVKSNLRHFCQQFVLGLDSMPAFEGEILRILGKERREIARVRSIGPYRGSIHSVDKGPFFKRNEVAETFRLRLDVELSDPLIVTAIELFPRDETSRPGNIEISDSGEILIEHLNRAESIFVQALDRNGHPLNSAT